MKLAILIHAHKDLILLNKLIDNLSSNQIEIFVNIDKKSNIDLNLVHSNARLIKNRIPISWGGFSQVLATINSLKEICNSTEFDYLIFISGQDYPLLESDGILDFFRNSHKNDFMTYQSLDKNGWGAAAVRVNYYHSNSKNKFFTIPIYLINKFMKLFKLKRTMPLQLIPYGGSNWFNLTIDSVKYILNFIEKNKHFISYMKYTQCSDEIFFQTILCNSSFKSNIINDNLRYIDWSDCAKGISSNPNILLENDFNKILESKALFCRKIDSIISKELIILLQKKLSRNKKF